MDPIAQAESRKSQDIVRAELERKKRDLYKIYNPTNQDFEVVLNAAISPEVWTVPAKSDLIVPWYVAEKYRDEMADKIIYNKSDKAIIEENEKREAKGFAKMDLHTEQPRFEGRNIKNMMSKRNQIAAILVKGLHKEYGIGAETPAPTDKKENIKEFDSGDVFNETSSPSTTPEKPETVTPDVTDVDEKPPLYVATKDKAKK